MAGPHAVPEAPASANAAIARRVGIDTQDEVVVFIRRDSPICRSEGFASRAQVKIDRGGRSAIATLYTVSDGLVGPGEVGLSEAAWRRLGLEAPAAVTLSHPDPLPSLSKVRGKIFGRRLDPAGMGEIIRDVVNGRYSDVQLSSFLTACAARPLDLDETIGLTAAMIDTGDRLTWASGPVMDKHCVGGLPGNRTTPIVVSIVAACGLRMPKTSSRAITSPSGTADTMETLAPVTLDLSQMRQVVEREGACIVWGGSVRLSPADDLLIRVERALDLDGEGQLVASVLSKKIATGATHLLLDLPMGPTAKVRTHEAAAGLSDVLVRVAGHFGLTARTIVTDGAQPVGRGIGPALEARDVLAVLQGVPEAPQDLAARSVTLAGILLEMGGAVPVGAGEARAALCLRDGSAWRKFEAICDAQGGIRTPPLASHRRSIHAASSGTLTAIDNRRISKLAKLAGAPDAKAAGIELHVRLGDGVPRGQPLYTIHAQSPGELAYAGEFADASADLFAIL